jgi:hypothetical protein
MGVSGWLQVLAFLISREKAQYPFKKMGRPQNQSGCSGKEKKSLPLAGN